MGVSIERFHELQAEKDLTRLQISTLQRAEEKILAELDTVIIGLGRSVVCPSCHAPVGAACRWPAHWIDYTPKAAHFHGTRAELAGLKPSKGTS